MIGNQDFGDDDVDCGGGGWDFDSGRGGGPIFDSLCVTTSCTNTIKMNCAPGSAILSQFLF